MSMAIKIENLSKVYQLGQIGTGTIYNDLKRWSAKIQGKEDPFLKIGERNTRDSKGSNIVYSLKDINLEINQGEALGIIGRNGAGKSTLLKLISRITSPSSGQIKIKGRVASLLEVGTGFHPELTGRENIFLNGSILGMRKAEIKQKLDEIIDFSGVERYIDTPVKRYSSGMYVRLAFAVAAHLDSEILIVDEVLSVGDAEFQKKCLGKMNDVSKGMGRTVLFVSHNMGAIKTLCTRGLVLENGEQKMASDISSCVSFYLGGNDFANEKYFSNIKLENVFTLNRIYLNNENKTIQDKLDENESIELNTNITILSDSPEKYCITYHLYNEMGEALFSFSNDENVVLQKGENELKTIFPKQFFQAGTFFLHFYFVFENREALFVESDIMSFVVVDGMRELGIYMGKEPGSIRPSFEWQNKIV
ncbi:MAG: ABC transporter ATP-binding protein [Bacteroidota bacterium]